MAEEPTDSRPGPANLEELMALALRVAADAREAAIARFCRDHPSEDPALLRRAIDEFVQTKAGTNAAARHFDLGEQLTRLRSLSPPSGRYQPLGEVDRGGMGVVWRVHDQVLGRQLAMKTMLDQADDTGSATPQVLARFLDEAQVTAQLDHPGVVPVHELALDADGRVFFTMRFVRGQTADAVFQLSRRRVEGWTLTRALEVILKVCDTLAYAHAKGVIHRDLKPSNVMVGRFGEVYVMDWGLAKVLGQPDRRDVRIRPKDIASISRIATDRSRRAESDAESPVMTMDGAVVGTPSYMPPEQAAGHVDEVGPRADVYAVGAMLYALLTGRAPYMTPGAMVSPYTILGLVLQGPPPPVHRLDSTAPAELVAICEKAMARSPVQRYADSRELADDLRAFMENRVVKAHRTGAVAEMRAWVRRNRGVAGAALAVLLAVVGGGIGTAAFAFKANDQARVAKLEGERASRREQEVLRLGYRLAVQAANLAFDRGQFGAAANFLHDTSAELRRWEWRYLQAQLDPGGITSSVVAPSTVSSPPWTADGKRLLLPGEDGCLRVCDAVSLRPLHTVQVAEAPLGMAVPLDRAGNRALVVVLRVPVELRLWDAADAGLVHAATALQPGEVPAAVSGDRRRLLVASTDAPGARVVDAATGSLRLTPLRDCGHVVHASFDRTGDLLVTADAEGRLVLWETASGQAKTRVRRGPRAITAVALSDDGSRIATLMADGSAHVWDAASGEHLALLAEPLSGLAPSPPRSRTEPAGAPQPLRRGCIAFSRDGSEVAASGGDRVVRRFKVSDGTLIGRCMGHFEEVGRLEFDANGQRLLSCSHDATVRLWSRDDGPPLAVFFGEKATGWFSPGADGVLVVDQTGVRLHAIPTWVPRLPTSGRAGDVQVRALRRCRGLPWLAIRTAAAGVEVWDPLRNERLATYAGDCMIAGLSPDGEPLLVSRGVDAWEVRRPLRDPSNALRLPLGDIRCLDLDGDCAHLAAAQENGDVRVIDTATGREVATLRDPDAPRAPLCLAFGGATRLATGSEDGVVRVYSLTDATAPPLRLGGHRGMVWDVAMSEDGRTVASAAATDGVIRIWDLTAPGAPRLLRCQQDNVVALTFHPDGSRLAALSMDGALRLWDTGEGAEMLQWGLPFDRANSLVFSQDGTQLFVAGPTSSTRILDAEPQTERSAEMLRLSAARAAAERFVRDLQRTGSDYAAAAARIQAEPSLESTTKVMALDLLLQAMSGG